MRRSINPSRSSSSSCPSRNYRYQKYQQLHSSNSSLSSSSPSSPLTNQPFFQDMSLTTIPFEILIEICSYLHPSDLYTLTTICKRYRILLWHKTSTTTRLIWKSSRKHFIPNLNIDPPERMCEQEYIWLMWLSDKCTFCDQSDKSELTMHWEFKMYTCFKCLNERTISQPQLLKKFEFPEELLICLSPLQRNLNPRDPPTFLIKDVENLLLQYNREKDKQKWINEQRDKFVKLNLEHEIEQYNTLHDQVRYDHTERLERLLRKLHEFYSDHINEMHNITESLRNES